MDQNLESGVDGLHSVPGWLNVLRPSVWGPEAVWPASFGAGGFLMWELIKVIGSDPVRAYPLLMKWGPNVFAIIIVAVILGAFLNRLVDVLGQNAVAQTQTAHALGEISARMPDRTATDDMRLQISFIGQKQDQTSDDVRGSKRALERIENHLGIQPPDKE